jgi:hypothetical protein
MGFEEMWHELEPVGRAARSGGYFRQPWTGAEGELRAWFAEAAAARGLRLETDGLGNQVIPSSISIMSMTLLPNYDFMCIIPCVLNMVKI